MSKHNTEFTYTSARERALKQSTGFVSPYLKVPPGVILFKPKAGTYLLDILPFRAGKDNPWAEKGNLHWERTFYVHRKIGANGEDHLCPRMNKKGKCPICEARLRLMKQGDADEDKERLIADMAPKQRQLFNIIDLKDPERKVQLWDISYHLFGRAVDAELRSSEEDEAWENFFFFDSGMAVKVHFVEESFGGHAFFKAETVHFKARKEQYDADILDRVVPLDSILVLTEYDALKKIFLQIEDEDDDADEAPRKTVTKPTDDDGKIRKALKRMKEEEEEDDDTEEEDEEAPPVKKKKKLAAAAADEEEDDDTEEEEEDEAPPVKKKKKLAAADEGDDEEENDDTEEEEDEAPPVKKKKKTVAAADDEDEEETDDEDDDEEAPPVKKKKKLDAADEDDEDDDTEEEEETDDEDEEAPPVKKKKIVKQFAKADADGWDDFDKEDEDEDEAPPVKKKKAKG